MSSTAQMSTPDAADRHARFAGIAGLLVATKYVVSASMHFADGTLLRVLDAAEIGIMAIAILVVAPFIYWKIAKLPRHERGLYFGPDSFVVESMRSARKASWAITMISLFVLEFLSATQSQLPGEFFIQIAIAIIFASFSVSFLYLMRGDGGDA